MDRKKEKRAAVFGVNVSDIGTGMLSIISSKCMARIPMNEIEVIEQEGRLLHIITVNKEYTIYESIEMIAPIVDDDSFFRALKYMIINFDTVRDIDGYYINFESGKSVSMGRNSMSKTREAFKMYLINKSKSTYYTEHIKVAEKTI